MSCSAGSMPEAFAAIMATHMTMCPQCQKDLALMEHIGTALFAELAPTPVDAPAPVAALRGLEAEVELLGKPAAETAGDVPATLVPVVGPDLENVTWTRVAPGVWQHRIDLSPGARGELRLIKVAPGQALPEHSHNGSEMTLVLRGSYSDNTGVYKAGDVADLDEDVTHKPIADPDDGCICLIATIGRLKFTSPLARMIQPLTGF